MRMMFCFIILYIRNSYINNQTQPGVTRMSAGDDKRALKRYMHASTHECTHTQQHVRVQSCVCMCVYTYARRDLSDTPCVRSNPENVSSIAHCVSTNLVPIMHTKWPFSMRICAAIETAKTTLLNLFFVILRDILA